MVFGVFVFMPTHKKYNPQLQVKPLQQIVESEVESVATFMVFLKL